MWLFDLTSYDYILPEDRIAQEPHHPADEAKLLVCGQDFQDAKYIDLPMLLDKNSVLFFNDTKVMQSRVPVVWKQAKLSTGIDTTIEQWEIFVYEIVDEYRFEALVADGKHYRPGSRIVWDENVVLDSVAFTQEGILFQISGMTVSDFMQAYGQLPLPPYITYTKDKEQRYQTCFAKYMGSAAAPTASLHFTPRLLSGLSDAWHTLEYATLHVGLWTFKPVYQEDIRKHDIHQEVGMIDVALFDRIVQYRQEWRPIIAVGTTMMRLLESLPYVWQALKRWNTALLQCFSDETAMFWDELIVWIPDTNYIIDSGSSPEWQVFRLEWQYLYFQTKIFIYPGFSFRVVDQLITNFHLPKSSLLMLVAACMGDKRKIAYDHVLSHEYMFYSFGDGMWIKKFTDQSV